MTLKPSPEYLAACRRVLNDDSPRTVMTAICQNDPRIKLVEVLARLDPRLWYCVAIEDDVPQLWATGATEHEARQKAEREVKQRQRDNPRSKWRFAHYRPE